jgi:hypothetical protein
LVHRLGSGVANLLGMLRLAGGLLVFCLLLSGSPAYALMRPHVLLDSGRAGPVQWEVLAWRDGGPHGSRRPCSGIRLRHVGSETINTFAGCGSIPPPAPLFHSATDGSGKAQRTVFSFVAARSVRRIKLDFGSRGDRRIRPKLLSRYKAAKAGVQRFRYASFALAGSFCLRGFTEFDSGGGVIVSTGRTPCQR